MLNLEQSPGFPVRMMSEKLPLNTLSAWNQHVVHSNKKIDIEHLKIQFDRKKNEIPKYFKVK